ncbi:DUF3152 domain-containing protein [Streptomyces sp. AJS327]|uniref:DUF3152 domain-containing protein n=1 Tax=Streptomyces sp. AJS327 TaxID=2545265 RepID=UPI001C610204|nr:DUF3152 domain-containing protein [Streptomyces sp. AJS327]
MAAPPSGGPGTPPRGTRGPWPGGAPGPAAARGGHPQQREPGGGWGARGTGQGPPAPRPQRSGPRQDYVDAFDERNFSASPASGRPEHKGLLPGGRVPGQRGAGRPPAGGQGTGPPDDGEPLAPLAPIPPPGGKGGRGRTYTGVAAAAVTTVLAVVVAGQVAGGDRGHGGSESPSGSGRAGEQEQASRSDGRGAPSQTPKPDAKPLSYADKMAKRYPLAPDFAGSGAFATVRGHDDGPGRGTRVRYRVDVEKGLPLEAELFAKAVHKTLNDDRSWAHAGERSFERVSSGEVDFVITLASPKTTAVWCRKSQLDTLEDNVSCDSAATERIMINAYRWARGAKTFGADRIHAYRQMLINHEVGHRLGRGHVGCSRQGAIAPVMMQQTKFLTTDGATCRPNAWPYPRG